LIFKTITIVVVSILSYSDHSASDSNVFIATVGENLCSPSNLFIQALIQFLIILLSKYVSAYRGALEFPKSENLSPNWSNLSKKAPVSKKIGLKLRSFSRHLTPIKAFFTYIFFLLLSWVFVAYIVVCFGAPLLNQHWETCSFVTLLCFQTIWPILLIEGITDVKKFQNLVQGQHLDELGQVLYFQAAGASLGAWLGAFPIPLDWDRAWQAWPLTCVIGSFLVSFLTTLIRYFLLLITKEKKIGLGKSVYKKSS